MPKHRPMLSAAASFAAGIAATRWLSLDLWPAVFLGGCCAACLIALRVKLSDGVRAALVLLLMAAAGSATEAVHTGAARGRAESSLARLLGPDRTLCIITGTVGGEITSAKISPLIETPQSEPSEMSSFRIDAAEIESNGIARSTFGEVKVSVKGEAGSVGHGDGVRVLGWIAPLEPENLSHRYDASKGIVARMSAAGPDAVRIERSNPGSFLRFLYAIKQSFREQIDTYFGGETAAVLKATLLGDRERLGRRLGGMFNKSGTTHILAISGLHVGIVYAAAIWLCRMLLIQRWPRRVIVLGAVISYAVMVGFRPATIRAVVMIGFLEIGDALRFYRDPINAVAATALVILAAAPQHLFEAGFQLTFIAVLGIILFGQDIKQLMRREPDDLERLIDPEFQSRRRRVARVAGKAAASGVGVCAAATLVVAPLQAYYFNIVTPVSVIATALLVPIIGALIWIGFVFLALASFAPAVACAVAYVLAAMVWLFTRVVELASAAPFGHVFVAPPAAGWIWLFYAALLVVAARRWLRLSGRAAVIAPAIVLCAYVAWRACLCPGAELAATFVDVGHGASVIITKGRETVVYDCGSGTPFSTYDVGRGPAAQQLWKMGVKRIDLLILSHTDADHVNGVASLIERFPVGRIVANRTFGDDEVGVALTQVFAARGIPFAEAQEGDELAVGDIRIAVLWPPAAGTQWRLSAVNDRSLVALVTSGGRSLLLTGDIEQAGMGGLLAGRKDLRADVLYVPHHGVNEPVLAEFVGAVRPKIAVISAKRKVDVITAKGLEVEEDDQVDKLLRGARTYRTSGSGEHHDRCHAERLDRDDRKTGFRSVGRLGGFSAIIPIRL
ncbi:MAG: DNA internalization-related competence protein ComEC/Rec2 [Planctomycetota bacterium]